jgi:hypothetical protein
MKNVTKLFLSLCLVVGLGATLTSNAQIYSNVTIRTNVPYSFVVGDTTLPAGLYTIRYAGYEDLNVLEIRSVTSKTAVFFDTEPVSVKNARGTTELVFNKIGDTYFLSQVFLQGDNSANQLAKSKMQRRLEEANSAGATQRSINVVRIPVKVVKALVGKHN